MSAAVVVAIAIIVALPQTAAACATCISTGVGDRAYTWPYIGLILAPFVIAGGIVATLAWYAGWRPRHVRHAIVEWFKLPPRTHTETP